MNLEQETFPSGAELAQLCLEQATAFPENHDQRWWFTPAPNACGTAGCLAGHAVLLGSEYNQVRGQTIRLNPIDFMASPTLRGMAEEVRVDNATAREVRALAIDLLELDEDQAEILFSPDRTVDELWELATQFYGADKIRRPSKEELEVIREKDSLFVQTVWVVN